jgi:hypothetical protein
MEGAKCFKNVPLTIAKRSQLRLSTVLHKGLFNEDPVTSIKNPESGSSSYSKLLRSTDNVADSAVFKNTEYRQNMLLVLEVHSQDKITGGWLKKIVIRGNNVLFLVTKKDCYRGRFEYFESVVGSSKEALVDSEDLRCFKPLLPRGTEQSYVFFLHGKLIDD